MGIFQVLFVILVIGIAVYLINAYAPMDAKFKTILNWAAVIIVLFWLARVFGLIPGNANIPVGPVK